MDGYLGIIIGTTAAFFLLAYVLLAPVYRFLKREEQISKQWTPESLAERSFDETSANGAHEDEDDGAAR